MTPLTWQEMEFAVKKVYPDAFLARIDNAELYMVQVKSRGALGPGLSGWVASKPLAWERAYEHLPIVTVEQKEVLSIHADAYCTTKMTKEMSSDKQSNGLKTQLYCGVIFLPAKPYRKELGEGWDVTREGATQKAWASAHAHLFPSVPVAAQEGEPQEVDLPTLEIRERTIWQLVNEVKHGSHWKNIGQFKFIDGRYFWQPRAAVHGAEEGGKDAGTNTRSNRSDSGGSDSGLSGRRTDGSNVSVAAQEVERERFDAWFDAYCPRPEESPANNPANNQSIQTDMIRDWRIKKVAASAAWQARASLDAPKRPTDLERIQASYTHGSQSAKPDPSTPEPRKSDSHFASDLRVGSCDRHFELHGKIIGGPAGCVNWEPVAEASTIPVAPKDEPEFDEVAIAANGWWDKNADTLDGMGRVECALTGFQAGSRWRRSSVPSVAATLRVQEKEG